MVILISNMLRSWTVLTFGSISFLNCCSFWQAGSSFPNQNHYQITNFDGSFKGLCPPGCLGNSGCRLDQSEMDTGEKSQHGVKCIVAQISNRMKCLAGPFMGKTHDCKMLDHSCWLKILAKEAAAGRVWVLFGNAGFQHCCRQWIYAIVVSSILGLHLAYSADFQQLHVQVQNLHWELLCRF